MGDKRHWSVSWVAELLVVMLLLAAGLSYSFDLGERWFGWESADPRTEPAAVQPPEGLRLPPAELAGSVAAVDEGGQVDPALLAARIRPLLRPRTLGRHYTVLVTDLATGRPLFRQGAAAVTPASTTKLLTSTAALESLGPMTTFRTTVRRVPETNEVILVGGGDPFLASSPRRSSGSYPERADIRTLARRTAPELRKQGLSQVRLSYDDSYFTGPGVNPAWPDDYVPDGVVPPIGALWVDQGQSDSGFGYVDDPAGDAASDFAKALRGAGIRVRPRVVRRVSPPTAEEVAVVSSAPLGEIVERTLEVSDNQAAEVLARHVGLAERQQGSFTAGTAAVLDVLARLGVEVEGTRLYDGSGLSRRNVVRPAALTGVLRIAASEQHPDLRHLITGLPVAGFTGSLQARFDRGPDEARGRVRAKTGTLTGVHGLAGVAEDVAGGRMAFAVVADRVPLAKTLDARLLIDRIAGRLGACRCGVGSSP